MYNAAQDYKRIDDLFKEIQEKCEKLSEEISTIDLKVSDVEHFIEITPNLNAAEGYKAYRLLKELLEKRRVIKNHSNSYSAMGRYMNSIGNKRAYDRMKHNVEKHERFRKQDEATKEYNVRVLNEIFGETITSNSEQ